MDGLSPDARIPGWVHPVMTKRRGKAFSRRDFLRIAGIGAGAVVVKGCSPRAVLDWLAPTPIIPPTPFLMPTAAPTQDPTASPTLTLRPTETSTGTPRPTATSTPAPFPTWTPTLPSSPTWTASPESSPTPSGILFHDFQVPAEGTFRQLRHDFENPEWGHKPRSSAFNPGSRNSALPETVELQPFNGEDFVRLTEEMQWFHFRLLAKANPGLTTAELKDRWKALTVNSVAFTDKHSIDYGTRFFHGDRSKNYADFILGLNLKNPKPIAWKAISTGGNLVKIVSLPRTIEAIDFTKPLPSIDEVWAKPWLIHWATEETLDLLPFTSTVDGATRKVWRVSPFPQMRPVGTPFPIWGRGGVNRIKKTTSLKSVANGQVFSPYVP